MRRLGWTGLLLWSALVAGGGCLSPENEADAGRTDAGHDAGGPSLPDAGSSDAGSDDAGLSASVHLEASADRRDAVYLSWDASGVDFTGFIVERDGVEVGVTGAAQRTLVDSSATAGWLAAPGAVVASEKEKDGIRVSWEPAVGDAGTEHVYVVRGALADGGVLSSNEAHGQRAAPVADLYEVAHADAGAFATTSELSVFDADAGGWSLDASVQITATEDDFRTTMILSADAAIGLERFPVEYRVRALERDGGAVSDWSSAVTGRRTDELFVDWQWQRSAGPTSTGFADLPRVIGPRWFDPWPVLDETRFYRLALRVERLGEVVSPSASATLYRPQAIVMADVGLVPRLCVLRSDGALHCHVDAQGAEQTWDAGRDIVQLSGSPALVCGLRADAGTDCWGTSQPAPPQLGPVVQIYVQDDASPVCGLRADGVAVCNSGMPATPDGGWWTFGVKGSATSLDTWGIRATDRAYQYLPGPASAWAAEERQGPYSAIYVPQSGDNLTTAVGVLENGEIRWASLQQNSYALPTAPGGYRAVSSHGYATCGVRTDGRVVCRGQDSIYPARTSTNVGYRQLFVRHAQACGITTDDHVECWRNEAWALGGVLLPPRMPVSDVVVDEDDRFRFLDLAGQLIEYGRGPLPNVDVTPELRLAALPRGFGNHALLVQEDGGLLESPWATVPPGPYLKVDRNCRLDPNEAIWCDGWGVFGDFVDVAGGIQKCGLLRNGSVQCQSGTPLPDAGPFIAIATSENGILCAQRPDGTVVCDPAWGPPGLAEPVSQYDVSYSHLCGVKLDGGVVCVDEPSASPLPPAPFGTYRKVSVGQTLACGIRTDDTGVCWGNSADGGGIPQP